MEAPGDGDIGLSRVMYCQCHAALITVLRCSDYQTSLGPGGLTELSSQENVIQEVILVSCQDMYIQISSENYQR